MKKESTAQTYTQHIFLHKLHTNVVDINVPQHRLSSINHSHVKYVLKFLSTAYSFHQNFQFLFFFLFPQHPAPFFHLFEYKICSAIQGLVTGTKMKAISVNESLQNMLYMVLTGSKISMDYAGNNVKRNTSMVKYMIYNMGRINKVCIKKITSCIFFFSLICIT